MLRWLWNIIVGQWGCDHHWEIIKQVNIMEDESSKRPIGYKYILRCEKCGDIKFKKAMN